MLEEFIQYMSKWTTIEELILTGIGLVFIVVLWICGGLYEKELENKDKKGE